MNITNNAYFDTGAVWRYISTDEASRYTQQDGEHSFYIAVSGTAGNPVSWINALTINNNGSLSAMPDNNNILHQIGKAKIGAVGSDEAIFAHFDEATSTKYALKQDTGGNTFLNGEAGCFLKFNNNNRLYVLNDRINIIVWLETDNISMGKSTFLAWNTSYSVLQAGGNGAVFSNTAVGANGAMNITNNAYFDTGAVWRYISTDEASRYTQQDGEHFFYVKTSGTAGNNISPWTLAAKFNVSGNFIARPDDNNAVHEIGKMKVGGLSSDIGAISHYDQFTSNGCALRQDSAGRIVLNGPDNDASAIQINFGGVYIFKVDTSNNAEILHIGQAQNLTEIIALPETYTDGIHYLVGKKVVTTDATQTTAATVTLDDDSLYMFLVQIVAIETTTNSEQAQYFLGSAFYRDGGGGATVLNGVQSLFSGESDPAFDATMDASGNDVRVRVTGLAATSVRWAVYIRYWKNTLSP
jgi:hypothetical protein